MTGKYVVSNSQCKQGVHLIEIDCFSLVPLAKFHPTNPAFDLAL